MKTREDMLHNCGNCMFCYEENNGLLLCSVYPNHVRVTNSFFCGQWNHVNNYETQFNNAADLTI